MRAFFFTRATHGKSWPGSSPRGRSTIATTNVPVGRWDDVFGDNVTASAIADRLCHHCTLVKITGRSYRLKDVSIGGDDGKEGAS